MIDQEDKAILESSTLFWNQTEEIIKKSEQLRQELVIPAIMELRYAGRKLTDYILARMNGSTEIECKKHIYDYEQCCIRARHDAIDAAVMYMKDYYAVMVKNFGIDVIQNAYAYHADLRHAITVVERRVQVSRSERHTRNDLYTEINSTDFDSLLERFKQLIDSDEVARGIKAARDREHRIAVASIWLGVLGFLIGIGGLLLALA